MNIMNVFKFGKSTLSRKSIKEKLVYLNRQIYLYSTHYGFSYHSSANTLKTDIAYKVDHEKTMNFGTLVSVVQETPRLGSDIYYGDEGKVEFLCFLGFPCDRYSFDVAFGNFVESFKPVWPNVEYLFTSKEFMAFSQLPEGNTESENIVATLRHVEDSL